MQNPALFQNILLAKETLSKLKNYYLGDKVILVKNECKVKVLGKVNESMQNKRNYYNFDETRDIDKAELQLKSILDYFSIQNQNFDRFKELEKKLYILKI